MSYPAASQSCSCECTLRSQDHDIHQIEEGFEVVDALPSSTDDTVSTTTQYTCPYIAPSRPLNAQTQADIAEAVNTGLQPYNYNSTYNHNTPSIEVNNVDCSTAGLFEDEGLDNDYTGMSDSLAVEAGLCTAHSSMTSSMQLSMTSVSINMHFMSPRKMSSRPSFSRTNSSILLSEIGAWTHGHGYYLITPIALSHEPEHCRGPMPALPVPTRSATISFLDEYMKEFPEHLRFDRHHTV